jgi:hypothetical protein
LIALILILCLAQPFVGDAQERKTTVEDIEEKWSSVMWCRDTVLQDSDLRGKIYEQDTKACSLADRAIRQYARGHFSESDVTRLESNALVAAAVAEYSKSGNRATLDEKFKGLSYCRRVCMGFAALAR